MTTSTMEEWEPGLSLVATMIGCDERNVTVLVGDYSKTTTTGRTTIWGQYGSAVVSVSNHTVVKITIKIARGCSPEYYLTRTSIAHAKRLPGHHPAWKQKNQLRSPDTLTVEALEAPFETICGCPLEEHGKDFPMAETSSFDQFCKPPRARDLPLIAEGLAAREEKRRLQDDLDALDKEFKRVRDRADSLEQTNTTQRDEIRDLKEKNAEAHQQIQDLTTKLTSLRKRARDLADDTDLQVVWSTPAKKRRSTRKIVKGEDSS